jgi:hypothetical protein
MTTRALNENLKIVEVPIAYSERVGRSKLSVVRDGVRFTNTIVWTTMTYNPVRVWGGIGLALVVVAGLLAAILVADWFLAGSLLGDWGPFVAFPMLVLGVTGASVFVFGVMFSYLIAIFTNKPVRRGMFGRVIFDPPLDYSFGWMGLLAGAIGILIGGGSLVLLGQGSSLNQIWVWLLLSALLFLVGAQLAMAYLVIRVLDELTQRKVSTQRDLQEPNEVETTEVVEVGVNAR